MININMLYICHRGNYNGPCKEENNPTYILKSLSFGYDAEIDVWFIDNEFLLGHDEPKYNVSEKMLENKHLWCHAKNIEAFEKMLNNKNIHCFYHDKDDCTLTSKGFIWTFPNEKNLLTSKSVAVLPELVSNWNYLDKCYAVCTDFIDNIII